MSTARAFIDMAAQNGGTTPCYGQQHFDMLPADPVLRKNSMDDIDSSFECSAFCSLLPGVSLVGTAV